MTKFLNGSLATQEPTTGLYAAHNKISSNTGDVTMETSPVILIVGRVLSDINVSRSLKVIVWSDVAMCLLHVIIE